MSKPLSGVATIEEAVAKVTSALAARGFGIITQIDVQAVMKDKLGIERAPYRILGVCNPQKANQVIEADPIAGLLLPCKVVVYQRAAGDFVVVFARPEAMFRLVERPELAALGEEVGAELRAAFDAL